MALRKIDLVVPNGEKNASPEAVQKAAHDTGLEELVLSLPQGYDTLVGERGSQIQTSLEQLSEGRTTITVAHRLSTIRNADRILVLENGEIVEEGTHAALISKNGRYTELASRMIEIQEI